MSLLVVVVVLYPLILLSISVYRARSVTSHDDFMVAGRSVPVYMLVGTLVCTWIGSGSLFGASGLAYTVGISELRFSSGAWIGLIVAYFLAGRVRRIADYTVPDLLERRYNPTARILGTVTIILAYVAIASYQFRGGGWILAIVTDGAITPVQGMLITALAIVLFTAMAGMVSIVSVDIFNGIAILVGVVLALPYMVWKLGGVSGVIDKLPVEHTTILGGHNWLWVVGIAMPTFLLLLGESGMYQKFFSAKDENAARRAVAGMVIGVVIIETALALLAITGRAANPELLGTSEIIGRAASETVILDIARNHLPLFLGAIMLAAGIAIVLSTGRDIYQRFINPAASQKQLLRMQRGCIVAFGIIGLLLQTQFSQVLELALYSYSLVGASLTPALLAAFLWKRVTPQGGTACIAGGMVTVVGLVIMSRVVIPFAMEIGGTVFDFTSSDYIVIPAVIVTVGLLIGVSLMTPVSPKEKWQAFFE